MKSANTVSDNHHKEKEDLFTVRTVFFFFSYTEVMCVFVTSVLSRGFTPL